VATCDNREESAEKYRKFNNVKEEPIAREVEGREREKKERDGREKRRIGSLQI